MFYSCLLLSWYQLIGLATRSYPAVTLLQSLQIDLKSLTSPMPWPQPASYSSTKGEPKMQSQTSNEGPETAAFLTPKPRPTGGEFYKFCRISTEIGQGAAVPINSRLDAANDSALPWPDIIKWSTTKPRDLSDMWIHLDLWSTSEFLRIHYSGCLFRCRNFLPRHFRLNLGLPPPLNWSVASGLHSAEPNARPETPEDWDHKVGILDELNHPQKISYAYALCIDREGCFLWHPSCLLLGHQHALNIPNPNATHPPQKNHISHIEPASSNAHLLRGSFQLNASPVCWQPASPFFSYIHILKHNCVLLTQHRPSKSMKIRLGAIVCNLYIWNWYQHCCSMTLLYPLSTTLTSETKKRSWVAKVTDFKGSDKSSQLGDCTLTISQECWS